MQLCNWFILMFKIFPRVKAYFPISMCVSLCLANTGAKWSFWSWVLSNAFLALVSGLYVLHSQFPLSQPGIAVWEAICLGCWLAEQCTRWVLAAWQLASHLKDTCSARHHRRLLLLYPWKGGRAAGTCLHCALFVAGQEAQNGLTPAPCAGETLPRTTAAHRHWADTALGGGKGYWVGKSWKRWHRAQSW